MTIVSGHLSDEPQHTLVACGAVDLLRTQVLQIIINNLSSGLLHLPKYMIIACIDELPESKHKREQEFQKIPLWNPRISSKQLYAKAPSQKPLGKNNAHDTSSAERYKHSVKRATHEIAQRSELINMDFQRLEQDWCKKASASKTH